MSNPLRTGVTGMGDGPTSTSNFMPRKRPIQAPFWKGL